MDKILSQIKQLLPQGKFVRSITILAGGAALGQIVLVLSLPLLTRLYTPDDLGKFGLFTAFTGIATVGSSLMYETAIVSAQDDDEAVNLSLLSIALACVITPLITFVFYLLLKFQLFGFGELPITTVFLSGIAIFFVSIFQILRYWFIRQSNFKLVSQITVIQNIIRALSQVGLGIFQLGWLGLFLGDILGRGAGIGRMLKKSWSDLTRQGILIKSTELKKVILKYYNFPIYGLPSALINVLGGSLAVPILADIYTTENAGYFVLARQVLSLPVAFVGKSVGDVFHSEVAIYARDKPEEVKTFFLKTAKKLAVLTLLPSLLVIVIAPTVSPVIFGQSWAITGILISIIAPWAWSELIVSSLSRLVFVFNGQRVKLFYDILALASVILALYLGKFLELSLEQTIILLSGLKFISYIIYFVILLKIINFNEQFRQTKKISTSN
jgi:O-antigen/teichoic acid export membrane protein